MQVCGDSHTATEFISKIWKWEIIARDCSCFHYFNIGICSCGDYWWGEEPRTKHFLAVCLQGLYKGIMR
jgi:hypothetical protein